MLRQKYINAFVVVGFHSSFTKGQQGIPKEVHGQCSQHVHRLKEAAEHVKIFSLQEESSAQDPNKIKQADRH